MKTSELIEKMKSALVEFGDLDVKLDQPVDGIQHAHEILGCGVYSADGGAARIFVMFREGAGSGGSSVSGERSCLGNRRH